MEKGFERKFTVINENDLYKYVDSKQYAKLNEILSEIQRGRELSGKRPYNNYVVINLDEPYIDEVIEIMKRHGHWG